MVRDMTEKIEHTLKRWEKKYGYLGLSPKEREFFSPVMNKSFTLKILRKELYERKIDKQNRIWVSHGALSGLEAGDVLVIGQDKKGNYYIERKR